MSEDHRMTGTVGIREQDLPVDNARLEPFRLTIRKPNGASRSNVIEAIRRRETSSSPWAWDCKTIIQRPSTVVATVSMEPNKLKRVNSVFWDSRMCQSSELRNVPYNSKSMKSNVTASFRPLGECRSASLENGRWRRASNPTPSIPVQENNIETSYSDILKYGDRQSMDTLQKNHQPASVHQNKSRFEKQTTFINVSKFPIVAKSQNQEKSFVSDSLWSRRIIQRGENVVKQNQLSHRNNTNNSLIQRKTRSATAIINGLHVTNHTLGSDHHQVDLAEPSFELARHRFSHSARDPDTRLKINGLSLSDISAINADEEANMANTQITPSMSYGSVKVTPSAANLAWSVGSWSRTKTKIHENSKPTKVRFNVSNDVKEYVPSEPVCATVDNS